MNKALFGVLAAGLALSGLVLYQHCYRAQPVMPAAKQRELAEPPALSRPRLSAPRLSAPAPPAAPESGASATNFLARWLKGEDIPKLTADQVESYLSANRRSAGSLLAACQATGDKQWLLEAQEKYPTNAAVAFCALFKSDSPQERRQWLDALKHAAPDNALADYLSANDHLKAGRSEEALRELETAYSKPSLQDYEAEQVQDTEEAYRAAGYSEAEAKAAAMSGLQLPQLAQLKQLAQGMLELAAAYRQAGDAASAQAALQIGSNLGQRLATGQGILIQDLVGSAIERLALNSMDSSSPYGASGQTVKERMDELAQQRQAIRALAASSGGLLETLPEPELAAYFERRKTFGEYPTMQWLVGKYGKVAGD